MQSLVIVVLILGVALAVPKPPPATVPGSAPWSMYAAKTGPFSVRSLVGLGGPFSAEDSADLSGISPFFKLKPFLPTKPTFMPPVVDPSKFIDMKASLLNSLFPGGLPMGPAAPSSPLAGAAPAAYSGLSARALLSPYAAPPSPVVPVVKPPPPAFLADLFKALNINKTVANATDAAPGYPAAPIYPAGPFVDPGVFISKKAKFLSDLMAGLATTTPAPPPQPAGPDAAALNAALAVSLQRLLDSLAATEDAPEDEIGASVKATRAVAAVDTGALVSDAKDKVVDTIIGELTELKNSMVSAVADLAEAQKAADAAVAAAAAPKKPVSPYAAMWAKPTAGAATKTPPPPAVESVHQKVVLLGQVFDMLTDMEKNISSSMAGADEAPLPPTPSPSTPDLMDMVKAKMSQMVNASTSSSTNKTASAIVPSFTSSSAPKSRRLAGAAPAPSSAVPVDPTFWIPDTAVVGPDAYLAKTKAFLANIMAAKSTPSPIVRRSYKPSIYQRDQDTLGQQQQQPQEQQQVPSGAAQSKFNAQELPSATLAYQLQQLQHHHHHNRQPYWWN